MFICHSEQANNIIVSFIISCIVVFCNAAREINSRKPATPYRDIFISDSKEERTEFINQILDVAFCVDYMTCYDLRCISGSFFDIVGSISSSEVERNTHAMIKPFIFSGLVNKVKQLVGTLKMEAFATPPEITYDTAAAPSNVLRAHHGTRA